MRIYYILVIVAIVLGFALTGTLLPFMPDEIPVHYNVAGEIDRMGSPWEMFVFPALGLLTGALCILFARLERRKSVDSERVNLLVGLWSVLLFDILGLYFGMMAIRFAAGNDISGATFLRVSGCLVGVLLVLFGLLMPRARRGGSFGLRTRWSVQNDVVWYRTQVVGCWLMVCTGLGSVLLCLLAPLHWGMPGMLMLVLCMTIAAYIVSWCLYKKFG